MSTKKQKTGIPGMERVMAVEEKRASLLELVDATIAAGPYKDNWGSLCRHSEPRWYQDAKFGIFVHWGVYAVPAFANEWYPRNMYIQGSPEFDHHVKTYGNHNDFGYKDFIPLFKGARFDADKWVCLARDAGAEYIMPVAEHHDGFMMYASELSEYNAMRMGPKRDVLGELRQAAQERGLFFALSNHRAENCWFFNGGLKFDSDVRLSKNKPFYGKQQAGGGQEIHDIYALPPTEPFCRDWLARLTELVERYRPSLVYLDTWVHNLAFKPYLKKFAAFYYNRATEWGVEVAINYKHYAFPAGAAVLDVERGGLGETSPRIWQTCTAVARNSWCHTEANEYKSPVEIVHALIDAVSKNGRLLLNVGPRADGVIVKEEREILYAVGRWLRKNGEGIYGTSCWEVYGEGPVADAAGGGAIPVGDEPKAYSPADIRFTCKGGSIYAFVMRFPDDGNITVKSLRRRMRPNAGGDFDITGISVLGEEARAIFKRDDQSLRVKVRLKKNDFPICLKISIN
jgi:alpha-L-fucosidase